MTRNSLLSWLEANSRKKRRQEIFIECTDKNYGPGVGLMVGINKRWKVVDSTNEEGTRKQVKACKCGSTTHQRPTHCECILNKKKTHNEPGCQEATPIQPPLIIPQVTVGPLPPTMATLRPAASRQTTPTMQLATLAPIATLRPTMLDAPIMTTPHPQPVATGHRPPLVTIMPLPPTMATVRPATSGPTIATSVVAMPAPMATLHPTMPDAPTMATLQPQAMATGHQYSVSSNIGTNNGNYTSSNGTGNCKLWTTKKKQQCLCSNKGAVQGKKHLQWKDGEWCQRLVLWWSTLKKVMPNSTKISRDDSGVVITYLLFSFQCQICHK
jgi:hypothetical protein